ncbi:MAG: hypothetical protein QOE66_1312, partial [Chloroflexota bacterium]|nr:hypothetical protein [Chloroflexota bacterium]
MIDVPPRSRGIPRPIPIRAARPTL